MINKLSTILFLILCAYGQVNAQCPPFGDYLLPTQSHVDDFLLSYPDCEEIDGSLTIGQFVQPVSTDINDLSGFINLKRVTGDFRLREIDGDDMFDGLQSIKFVGGGLYIEGNDNLKNLNSFESIDSINGEFWIRNNENLESLFNLNTINHIGEAIQIVSNNNLKSLDGFRNISELNNSLEIVDCPLVTNLDGFNSLSSINGKLSVSNTGISDLSELGNLQRIQGQSSGLAVIENSNLTSLQGLNNLLSIDGSFQVINNPNLNSISKLESLSFIGGYFEISESNLIDFVGLENAVLGFSGIVIKDNNLLTTIEQLKINSTVGGNLRIDNNESLSDITSLVTIDSINGGLAISKNDLLSNCESICHLLVEGYIEAPASIFQNLEGCNSQAEIISQNCISNTEELLNENSIITVFPNPVIDELNVKFITRPYAITNITLYNSFGQIINEEVPEKRFGTQIVDMSNHRQGLYLLVIKSEKGSVIKRIVKSN